MSPKGSINIILIIAVVVLAVVSLYLAKEVYFRTGGELPVQSLSQNTGFQPNLPLVQDDQTKDWKTYRNEKYGFEFKYPPQYTLLFDDKNIAGDDILIKNIGGGSVYAFLFIDNPEKLTPLGYFNRINNEPRSYGFYPFSEITVNNLRGVDASYGGGGGKGRSIFIGLRNKILKLDYATDNIMIDFNGDNLAFNEYLRNGESLLNTIKPIVK